MRIYHVATLADWQQAQRTGSYTTSTRGRTLRQEGFIHAAYHDQVPGVRDRYYGDATEPLVVLEIDTDLLEAEVRDEQVGEETYPHVYGPITRDAVVAWRPARMLPIDLGTARPAPAPLPPMTIAFRGLALVLAAAALTSFVAAVIASAKVDDDSLPRSVRFLLWSMTAILAVPAFAAVAYAEWARLRAPREA